MRVLTTYTTEDAYRHNSYNSKQVWPFLLQRPRGEGTDNSYMELW